MAGKFFSARPVQQPGGEPAEQRDHRAKNEMDQLERPREHEAKPVRVQSEQHFRQQFAEGIENQCTDEEAGGEQGRVFAHPILRADDHQARDSEIGQRVPGKNCPKKFLRLVEVTVESPGIGAARAHEPPDAHAAQGKDARFHSRKEKRERHSDRDEDEDRGIHLVMPGRFTMRSMFNSRTARSSKTRLSADSCQYSLTNWTLVISSKPQRTASTTSSPVTRRPSSITPLRLGRRSASRRCSQPSCYRGLVLRLEAGDIPAFTPSQAATT